MAIEANPAYWRRVPNIKRFVMKSVPEGLRGWRCSRLQEDLAYALDGEDALNVKRDPRLQLVPSKHASIYWIEFAEQWDPKSPWHDKRVRQALNYALNRQAINEASCLGFCLPTSVIVPRVMEFALQTVHPYDPQKAKQLAEAGYPNGIDAGDFVPIPLFFTTAEAAMNSMGAVGIRVKIRPMARGVLRRVAREESCAACSWSPPGTRATRPAAWRSSCIPRAATPMAAYPGLDDLFVQQSRERDVAKRGAAIGSSR